MTNYGLRVYDTAGIPLTITSDIGTVLAAGEASMPNVLEGDNTYGADITLDNTYNMEDLAVLVTPRQSAFSVKQERYIDTVLYHNTFYLNNSSTYYTRATGTGIMTSFSAGTKTLNDKSTWNPVCSVFPIAFWDKQGLDSTSNIRLFAATTYLIRSQGSDTNYSLAGTATGTNYNNGTPDLINDDSIADGSRCGGDAGAGAGAAPNSSGSLDWSVEIDLNGEKTINMLEVVVTLDAHATGGYATGDFTFSFYYDSAWHDSLYVAWSNDYQETKGTYRDVGYWRRCEKVKLSSSLFGQKGTGTTYAWAGCLVYELRAWGSTGTDDEENKIVYSIGSAGVANVDFLVCRKKFS